MDSLKFILGVIVLVLCMGGICAVIWVLLFGIPQGAMDGGTLVHNGKLASGGSLFENGWLAGQLLDSVWRGGSC